MKQILLLGANGQVGHELRHTLQPVGAVTALGRDQADLSQPEALREKVLAAHPDLIVNAAAYTAVDKAESEPDLAHQVNGVAPGVLAKAAAEIGAGLIHISTDYVFDGAQSHPYTETDATAPLGVYGQSKLAGEQAIQATDCTAIILRTAWVYGTYGKGNFAKTMLRLGGDREELRVVYDQVGTPSWARDIAGAIAHLAAHFSPAIAGLYHYTNSGAASWYDFAVAIFEEAAALGVPLKLQRVVPITTPEYPTPARRPAFSMLSPQKIQALLGAPPPHWRHSLRQMLAEWQTVQAQNQA